MNLFDPQLEKRALGAAVPVMVPGRDHVAVLLALHNGDRWLSDQLQSLERQRHCDWSLIVGDDQSNDRSLDIVREFARRRPGRSIRVLQGPGKGFQANFLDLLKYVPASASYVAFSDQDDWWKSGKLERAIAGLSRIPKGVPVLYCGRTEVTDATLAPLGNSPLFSRPPSFSNALVQSIAGGNTMVFNRPALDLMLRSLDTHHLPVSHDWWTYQIVSGVGGHILFDPATHVLYRQHDQNLVGAGTGLKARLKRLQRLWAGELGEFSKQNLLALQKASKHFTIENQARLHDFEEARKGGLIQRVRLMRRAGVHRQTLAGTLALWAAILFGCV